MASEEEESSKGFKVQDRRRFSAEGELKPEYSGAEERVRQTAGSPQEKGAQHSDSQDSAHRQQAAVASGSEQAAAAEGYAAARSSAGASHPAGAGEINFGAFLISLSTEVLVHLGEVADPSSGQPRRDLGMAQQLIDILGMLQVKTRGNLDHDEQALLDAILFDLRMKYVEIARRNG